MKTLMIRGGVTQACNIRKSQNHLLGRSLGDMTNLSFGRVDLAYLKRRAFVCVRGDTGSGAMSIEHALSFITGKETVVCRHLRAKVRRGRDLFPLSACWRERW